MCHAIHISNLIECQWWISVAQKALPVMKLCGVKIAGKPLVHCPTDVSIHV